MNAIDATLVALATYDDLKNRGRHLSERANEDAFCGQHVPTAFDDRLVKFVSIIRVLWPGGRLRVQP